jgi:hypothetical protein
MILSLLSPLGCVNNPFFDSQFPGLNPDITSEDIDLDPGGSEPPIITANFCLDENGEEIDLPKMYTLRIQSIENGTLGQDGENSPENPAILDIGQVFGPDDKEPLTRVHLDFITDATNILIGDDPNEFLVFFQFMTLDQSISAEFATDFIFNDPFLDENGIWIGNRIGEWHDPFAVFDGCCAPLDQTFILQACRGVILDPDTGEPITARSQPLFIQARLSPNSIF